jgi:hypothetical protein
LTTIYIASKTRHARRWQLLAAAGVPICSTWIYEAGPYETKDWTELWARCVREASTATAFILYREADDEILKGAYLELGAALASGVTCWYVGPDDGNVTRNGALRRVDTINHALREIIGPNEAEQAATIAGREARIDAELYRDRRFYPGKTT